MPSNPVGILTTSYYELLQNKVPLLGEHIQHKYTGIQEYTLSFLFDWKNVINFFINFLHKEKSICCMPMLYVLQI